MASLLSEHHKTNSRLTSAGKRYCVVFVHQSYRWGNGFPSETSGLGSRGNINIFKNLLLKTVFSSFWPICLNHDLHQIFKALFCLKKKTASNVCRILHFIHKRVSFTNRVKAQFISKVISLQITETSENHFTIIS